MAGCGVVIKEYFKEDKRYDEHVPKRIIYYTSPTSSEVHTIYMRIW